MDLVIGGLDTVAEVAMNCQHHPTGAANDDVILQSRNVHRSVMHLLSLLHDAYILHKFFISYIAQMVKRVALVPNVQQTLCPALCQLLRASSSSCFQHDWFGIATGMFEMC